MALHLFMLPKTVVFQARINQSSYTWPLSQLTYDGLAEGGPTNVLPGMTVLFGSGPGLDDYGRGYARKLVSPPTIYFGRSSRGVRDGEVDPSDNGWIEVLEEWRVWGKTPRIDGSTIYKDEDVALGDNGTEQLPVANCGPWRAGTIDPDTGKLTLNFTAANSVAIADGATIDSVLWGPGDGTITVGTVTSEEITIEFDAGHSWVSLFVQDSNGKQHTTHRLVVARDPANDECIQNWEVQSHRITREGQELSIAIYDSVPRDVYPDGCPVMLFEEPADADDTSNVIFWGWEQTNPNAVRATQTGTLKDSSITCVDVAGKMKTLPGFPQILSSVDAPTSWNEMANPNMDKLIHNLLQWNSTALLVADYFPSGTGADYQFIVRDTDGDTLWGQVQQQANAMIPDFVLVCNRRGQLKVLPDPLVRDIGDRPPATGQTFDSARWGEVEMVYQRPPRVHWFIRGAVTVSTLTLAEVTGPADYGAIFSQAPGTAPGQGAGNQNRNDGLASNQSVLNSCTGHHYARINSVWGRFRIRASAPFYKGEAGTAVRLIDYDPADMARIAFAIEASLQPPRGLGFLSSKLGMLHEMTINYKRDKTGMVRTVEFDWEAETFGGPAETYTPPAPE